MGLLGKLKMAVASESKKSNHKKPCCFSARSAEGMESKLAN
jgi:hypothetical protein